MLEVAASRPFRGRPVDHPYPVTDVNAVLAALTADV